MRKGVYHYEYMYEGENFNETSLPEKDDFYSNLSMEYLINEDYIHAKGIPKEIKN